VLDMRVGSLFLLKPVTSTAPTKEAQTQAQIKRRLDIWLYLRYLYRHRDPRKL
jgi:hypothetical protein